MVLNISQEVNNLRIPRHTFIILILKKNIDMALDKNKKAQPAKPADGKAKDTKKTATTSKKTATTSKKK